MSSSSILPLEPGGFLREMLRAQPTTHEPLYDQVCDISSSIKHRANELSHPGSLSERKVNVQDSDNWIWTSVQLSGGTTVLGVMDIRL